MGDRVCVEPGGGTDRTFKVYATKTGENGEFILPWTIKLKIPVIEIFQGINMLVYEHGYKCQYIERRVWRKGGRIKYYQITLEKIKDDEEYSKNLTKLRDLFGYWLSSDKYKHYDIQYILDEYKIFFDKYPQSRFLEENYINLAGFYEIQMKDYKSAIRVMNEFINKFSNSSSLNWAKKDLLRLEKLQKRVQK